MKEKKLYKIAFMGDKDHGCDIISTLESWGGSNYYSRTGNYPEYAYFINDLGTIDLIHNSEMLSEEEVKNFYFMFWHDYNIECHLKVGETINYGGQDYDVDGILFDANNKRIIYKLKSFGIGVEYITNNELTPTEEYKTEENNMGKKLAIAGHSTRGKEVIKLLEMLGGRAMGALRGNTDWYTIDEDENNLIKIYGHNYIRSHEFVVLTLEEFLEKYPFKVGDKVFLYDNITLGCVTGMKWNEETVKYCVYTSSECWCDVKDLLKWNTIDLAEKHYDEHCDDMYKTMFTIGPVMVPDKVDDKLEYEIIDGYEFDKVENGKIILKPIKPVYPKTYKECCDALLIPPYYNLRYHTYEPNYDEYATSKTLLSLEDKLNTLGKLFICRNAYWKIAGEQMGLGKPWEPDWLSGRNEEKYCIATQNNEIWHNFSEYGGNEILAFPTIEMRDVFYENFKELIESCKELL